jgi:hypothetical protein
MQEFDILDVFSRNLLSEDEKSRMKEIKVEIEDIWLQEETKAWQRSRDRFFLEGDRNTAYFHAVANQRRRKKTLAVLDGPLGPMYSNEEMLKIASSYYKDLFSKESKPSIFLGDNFWDANDLLTDEEVSLLDAPFSEEEFFNAVKSSYAAGAPGPDGFSFLFYQTFWSLIKVDFMALVRDFESGSLMLLDYTMLLLL